MCSKHAKTFEILNELQAEVKTLFKSCADYRKNFITSNHVQII